MKTGFCCRVLILSPWETYCKHWLNILDAQIGKLHLPIQSWIHHQNITSTLTSVLLEGQKGRKHLVFSQLLEAEIRGVFLSNLQTFLCRCSHSFSFLSPLLNQLWKKKNYSRNSWLRVLLRLYHSIIWSESSEENLFLNIIIITGVVLKSLLYLYLDTKFYWNIIRHLKLTEALSELKLNLPLSAVIKSALFSCCTRQFPLYF